MLSQLLVSALPGWSHPSHLSHRHSFWWAALQKDLMIQWHLLCQRLLVKVLAQVCKKKEFPVYQVLDGSMKCPLWPLGCRVYLRTCLQAAFTWGNRVHSGTLPRSCWLGLPETLGRPGFWV